MTSQNAAELLAPFWKRACARFTTTAPQTVVDKWFSKICTMMAVPPPPPSSSSSASSSSPSDSEMIRAYHNLHHVWELCDLYEKVVVPAKLGKVTPPPPPIQQPSSRSSSSSPSRPAAIVATEDDVIFLTAFFHDIVYDSKRGDNEEQSADLWLEFCKECGNVPVDVQNQVKNITLATKKHLEWNPPHHEERTADGKLKSAETMNTLIFLDMDLAILGADAPRYEEYSKQIRLEWRHVPEEDFRKGRSHFLAGMQQQQKKPFFRSPLFEELRGKQCYRNIAWELEKLGSQ